MATRRIRAHDIEGHLRSLAMSPQLPVNIVTDLLHEHRDLLNEHHQLEQLLDELGPAVRELRRVLNEMHRHLRPADPAHAAEAGRADR